MKIACDQKECEHCGTSYLPNNRSHSRARGSKYCSTLCANRAKSYPPEGTVTEKAGYLLAKVPNHPFAKASNGFRIGVHRLVVEKKLGRYLQPDEDVHHVNGDKLDNRPENLCVLPRTVHIRLRGTQCGEAMN